MAKVHRRFGRLEEARLVRRLNREAILHDEQSRRGRRSGETGAGQKVFDLLRGSPDQDADVTLIFKASENLGPGEVGGFLDFERDERRALGVGGEGLGPNRLGRIVLNRFTGGGIVARGDLGEPDFEEIGQLRHGADGGT